MRRNFKPLVITLVIAAASLLTITRHGHPGVGPTVAAPGDRRYDLASLRVFDTALKHVNDSYVDPGRIDPKAMLLSALDNVQKQVAEVLVEPRPAENKVVVRVDTQQQEFAIKDVDSPWVLSQKMKEIFKFVGANIMPGTDLKELEYSATNGMLNTLDPHSVLLEPQTYQEMKLTTKGQFGGLGIIIGLRGPNKDKLTVIKPLPNTPASNAGVKAGDHIVRIDKLSTVNMMLNDAVSRLRGDPGTKVDVWIERIGTGGFSPKKLVLTRDVIQVNTVTAHQLSNNIGYLRLSQFSGNSVDEMRRYLDEMKAKGPLKGLVLDLRGDPGGLLDQAIKVADEFVDSGTIVTTVGEANKHRDEKRATVGGQPKIPLAVLVNGGSASASEIVAGALKNLDRAVIIGSRTFGKGSVQVLYDNDDGSALKLTIAQYLTPGDVSIQSVGIMPDIALEPTAITKDKIALFREYKGLREQDLDAHLTSKNTRSGDKPEETLRYLVEQTKKLKDAKKALGPGPGVEEEVKDDDAADEPGDDEPPDEDKFVEDFEIQFARDLLAQAKGWRRHEILGSSKQFFDKKTAEEQQKVAAELSKLGVEWAPIGQTAPTQLGATLESDRKGNEVAAGEVIILKATVTNRGAAAAGQVRAITKSENPWLTNQEFIFGKLAPGETRSWSVPIRVEKGAPSRLDLVKLEVADEKGDKAEAEAVKVKMAGRARPRFSYSYQIIDDLPGTSDNGDGVVQRGEEVRLHVVVKNVGDGQSFKTQATLSNKSGDGIDVVKGRFDVDNIAPGASKTVDFTFVVQPDFGSDKFSLQMDVYDQVLREYVTDKLNFPIANPVVIGQAAGVVKVHHDKAEVRAGALLDAPVIGFAKHGAVFKLTGRTEQFWRVEVEPGHPAFLIATDAQQASQGSAAPVAGGFVPDPQVSPPRLVIESPPLAVNTQSMHLKVSASDEHQVADGYIFVSNRNAKIEHRKVFYRSNRRTKSPQTLSFEADVPLWPGANTVTVVARQSKEVQATQVLIVDRVGGNGNGDARAAAR